MIRLRITAAIWYWSVSSRARPLRIRNIGSRPGRQRNNWLLSHRFRGQGRTYRRRSRTRLCAWSREPASAGRRVRIQVSNAFGSKPLVIGNAHIALRDKAAAIVPTSDRALTFGGRSTMTVPPGALIVSDPVDLTVPKLTDLAISLYLPRPGNALDSPHRPAYQLHRGG